MNKANDMTENYLDGFVFPVSRAHLNTYRRVAEKVAEVWKDYGALTYVEYVGEDLELEGTRSFGEVLDLKAGEVAVFGWMLFPSKAIRDSANKQVPNDPRMAELLAPIIDPERLIFDARRMVYGGFMPLVQSDGSSPASRDESLK